MAWRIDENVIRGELDNRTRGRITGRIWFVGLDQPVEFELAGNGWRDLAGRRLEFVNPNPKPGKLDGLSLHQTGVIGDCTASRKVRVPEVSMDELGELYRQRKPFPWHWGNSLYFEWFSTTNGRVVIESACYQLTISPDIAWDMSPSEEEAQRRANVEAMGSFMQKLSQALAGKDVSSDAIEAAMRSESTDDRAELHLTPEEITEREAWFDEVNHAAEEAGNAGDPFPDREPHRRHPLTERAFVLALRLLEEPQGRGWLTSEDGEEHPLVDLGASTAKAGSKLASALDDEPWPPTQDLCTSTLARLKRARGYLDDAVMAAEICVLMGLGDTTWLREAQKELNGLCHECDLLTGELRSRME